MIDKRTLLVQLGDMWDIYDEWVKKGLCESVLGDSMVVKHQGKPLLTRKVLATQLFWQFCQWYHIN